MPAAGSELLRISSNPPTPPTGLSSLACAAGAPRSFSGFTTSASSVQHQDRGRARQQPRRSPAGDHIAGSQRPDPRAQAAADPNQGKKPLALFLGVEIAGERPELGDRHQVEDPDPQEVDDADVKAGAHGNDEQQQVGDEKQGHRPNQPDPVYARGQRAVRAPGTSSRTA